MPENQIPKRLNKDKYLVNTGISTRSTYDKASWLSVRYKAHSKDYSDILWETKFSIERLKEIYQEYLDQDYAEGYSQEYLNYPIDESMAYFKRTWFKEMMERGKEPLNYYIGTDFSATQKTKSDYCVFVVAGINADGVMKVVNVVRDKMDAFEIVEMFHILQRQYSPESFFVEKGAIWNMLNPMVERSMYEKQQFMTITGVPSTADKMARGKPLQARMRMGAVQFQKDAEWYPAFEDEFARFPRDVHDDQVDATTIIALAIQNMINAPTKEELEWEEFEEELYEYEMEQDEGFNFTTGY